MSYDLMVFDPSVAPFERNDFLRWYEERTTESDTETEPGLLNAELRSWYFEMIQEYPPLNGPHAGKYFDNQNRLTDYSLGQNFIYACFAWPEAKAAYRKVIALAKKHSLGFFDVSGSTKRIWRPRRTGQFDVFYCFYGTDESVPADLPLSMDLQQISTGLLPKLISDSDFIGITDAQGTTLQFMYEEQHNRVWMEIPLPERQGSYGTYMSREYLSVIVQDLPTVFRPESFPDLKFTPWDTSQRSEP